MLAPCQSKLWQCPTLQPEKLDYSDDSPSFVTSLSLVNSTMAMMPWQMSVTWPSSWLGKLPWLGRLDICHGGLQVGPSSSCFFITWKFSLVRKPQKKKNFRDSSQECRPVEYPSAMKPIERYRTSPSYITIYKWSFPQKKKQTLGLRWFPHIVFIGDLHIIYLGKL